MLYKLSYFLLFAVLTCGQISSAQVALPGKCPEVKLKKDFDWPSFKGVWYEYARYKTDSEDGYDCVYGTYTSKKIDTIEITVSGVNASNTPVSFDATGKILGPGRFFVTFKGNNVSRTDEILDADNKSWAVIYSCENVDSGNVQRAWVLTRERIPDANTFGKAEEVLNQNGISSKFLKYTRQNGCPAN